MLVCPCQPKKARASMRACVRVCVTSDDDKSYRRGQTSRIN